MIFKLCPIELLSPLPRSKLLCVLAYCDLPDYHNASVLSPVGANWSKESNVFLRASATFSLESYKSKRCWWKRKSDNFWRMSSDSARVRYPLQRKYEATQLGLFFSDGHHSSLLMSVNEEQWMSSYTRFPWQHPGTWEIRIFSCRSQNAFENVTLFLLDTAVWLIQRSEYFLGVFLKTLSKKLNCFSLTRQSGRFPSVPQLF